MSLMVSRYSPPAVALQRLLSNSDINKYPGLYYKSLLGSRIFIDFKHLALLQRTQFYTVKFI